MEQTAGRLREFNVVGEGVVELTVGGRVVKIRVAKGKGKTILLGIPDDIPVSAPRRKGSCAPGETEDNGLSRTQAAEPSDFEAARGGR